MPEGSPIHGGQRIRDSFNKVLSTMPSDGKTSFFGEDMPSLEALLIGGGFEKYRARQIWQNVYLRKVFEPAKMTSLPLALREFLDKKFEFTSGKLVGDRRSADDTGKFLFELSDGRYVECVILEAPDESGGTRKTLCLSTQVGCAQGCKFCASTMRGFKRNLTYSEILSQALSFVDSVSGKFLFENIVVMGMGEPLANFDNVMMALKILNDADRFNFGARRITLSTCGLADKILQIARMDFPFRLAVSLHGATDEVRSRIMPVNKRFPLEKLVPAIGEFSKNCGRMTTLEFILIEGVNDTPEQARALAKIAKKLHAHVNLIPYNTVSGLEWRRSPLKNRLAFAKILKDAKVSCTLRREKGSDIDAACGQLALKSSK